MKYRNEWKYLVSDNDLNIIKNKISNVLNLDEHSKGEKYIIHSLYFDDIKNSCAYDNEAGLGRRYKWRIRYYDDDKSYILLEKKEKKNGMCRKQKCLLSLKDYIRIENGEYVDLFWETNKKLLKKLCVDALTKGFRPKLIIDYEREAFVEPISNVRITFDKNITCSLETESFLGDEYLKYPINIKDKHVLEIKFDDILPNYIKQGVFIDRLSQISYSKYYLGRITAERGLKL